MEYHWRPMLERWNQELIESEEIRQNLPLDVRAAGWLGFPGASEEQLRAAEACLGVALPPSYRPFLAVTNGWNTLTHAIGKVWSAEEVAWFRVRNQVWIDTWVDETNAQQEAIVAGMQAMGIPAEPPAVSPPPVSDEEYFTYGVGQDPVSMGREYLPTALEVSDVGDSAVYLLNPQVVSPDGEWEAWFFANWLPGANRHRSFWEMMQAEHDTFVSLRDHQ